MKILLIVFAINLAAMAALGNVRIPDVISASMVLQQKKAVPIWGWAEPGEAVTVTFAGQKKTVVAGADGRWRVDLAKMNASDEPRTMMIVGKSTIELTDILVGEVWLLSGQSNMQWRLPESTDGVGATAAAKHPALRLFNVSREVAFKKRPGKLAEWMACTPESVKEFSAAGYYFGVDLQKTLKVPVGLINSSYGGSQAEAWTPVAYLNASPDLKPTVDRTKIWEAERETVRTNYAAAIAKWRDDQEKARAAGARPSPSPGVPDALRDYRIASSIYDGMIEPLMPYAIKGAIWYQGESNEARAEQYGLLMPTMIRAWRERWVQGNFPFGIIQLPNYRAVKPEPEESAWSFIREAQRQTALTTVNTGLIVIIDIGESNDIHPRNKIVVGKRMLAWALKDVYGLKASTPPVLKKTEVAGGKVVLTFENVGSGLKIGKGNKLEEFAIAGADKKFVWADAKIIGKNKIEVSSVSISSPVAVRYAFNSNPKNPNLTNDSGLPASPFRTDNWPDPTAGRR